MVTDRLIQIKTALAVLMVAGVAAVISYEDANELVTSHGETGFTAHLLPFYQRPYRPCSPFTRRRQHFAARGDFVCATTRPWRPPAEERIHTGVRKIGEVLASPKSGLRRPRDR